MTQGVTVGRSWVVTERVRVMLIVTIIFACAFVACGLQIWALCAIAHDDDGPAAAPVVTVAAEVHMPRRASM
jgi:hypothetical protein